MVVEQFPSKRQATAAMALQDFWARLTIMTLSKITTAKTRTMRTANSSIRRRKNIGDVCGIPTGRQQSGLGPAQGGAQGRPCSEDVPQRISAGNKNANCGGGGDGDNKYDVEEGGDATGLGTASCHPCSRRRMSTCGEKGPHINHPDSRSSRLLHLLSVADGPRNASVLPNKAIASSAAKDVDDAHLGLQWAEISQEIAQSLPGDVIEALVTLSPISILRWALKRTPLHHQCAHTLISTELVWRLMSQKVSPKIVDELKALFFQKLMLLSQGS